jgi:hypothetical protein
MKYRIEYVDYGTRAFLGPSSIFPLVVAENIPIFANRFVLTDVLPKNYQTWTLSELEYFHSRLCDNLSSVNIVRAIEHEPTIMGVEMKVEQAGKAIASVARQAVKECAARDCGRFDPSWPVQFMKADSVENYNPEPQDDDEIEDQIDEEEKAQVLTGIHKYDDAKLSEIKQHVENDGEGGAKKKKSDLASKIIAYRKKSSYRPPSRARKFFFKCFIKNILILIFLSCSRRLRKKGQNPSKRNKFSRSPIVRLQGIQLHFDWRL